MKKELKIFGQIIIGVIIISLGISTISFTIPGNRNFTDADQIYLFYRGAFLTVCIIGFLINSVIFYKKKQWPKYRKIAILLTILLVVLIFTMRNIITGTYYGKVLYTITNTNNAYTIIKLRLFQNKKFISETYDMCYNVENTGTYVLTDNELMLEFKEDKSQYLETQYRLKGDSLKSINSENETLIWNRN